MDLVLHGIWSGDKDPSWSLNNINRKHFCFFLMNCGSNSILESTETSLLHLSLSGNRGGGMELKEPKTKSKQNNQANKTKTKQNWWSKLLWVFPSSKPVLDAIVAIMISCGEFQKVKWNPNSQNLSCSPSRSVPREYLLDNLLWHLNLYTFRSKEGERSWIKVQSNRTGAHWPLKGACYKHCNAHHMHPQRLLSPWIQIKYPWQVSGFTGFFC